MQNIHRKLRKLRVFCDVMPIGKELASLCDHSGWRIFSLCSLPLFQTDKLGAIQPTAAQSWISKNNHKTYICQLRTDLIWPDGSRITGHAYKRGLEYLAGNRLHRFRGLFADLQGFKEFIRGETTGISGIEAGKDSITFHLRNHNILLPMLLTFPGASPRHRECPELMPGAYGILSVNTDKILLKAQPQARTTQKRLVELIEFDFQMPSEDLYALKRWEQGRIDMTWDCFFPYDRKSEYLGIDGFIQSDPGISVTLKPQACGLKISEKTMCYLHQAINRFQLCNILSPDSRPFFGYCSDSHVEAWVAGMKPEAIVIAYEEFIPNKQILELIINQLQGSHLRITLIEVPYGERCEQAHLKLTLIHNSFPDPLMFYRGEMVQESFYLSDKIRWREYACLLTEYQKVPKFQRNLIGHKMDQILIRSGRMIPLIKLPGYYLKCKHLDFHDYIPFRHWSWH